MFIMYIYTVYISKIFTRIYYIHIVYIMYKYIYVHVYIINIHTYHSMFCVHIMYTKTFILDEIKNY